MVEPRRNGCVRRSRLHRVGFEKKVVCEWSRDGEFNVNALIQNLQIHRVEQGQLERVKAILERCEMYITSITLEGSCYWLAHFDGLEVGCIGLEHGTGASLIRSAAVLPEFRSSGIGRTLTLFALEQAHLRGDRAVYLFTSDMGPYWQRFGFVEVPLETLVQALPDVSQVQSGMCMGWLEQSRAWKKTLEPRGV